MHAPEPNNDKSPRGRIGTKLVLSFVLLVMVVVGSSGWVLFQFTESSLEQQMSLHQVQAARLVSTLIAGDVLRRLQPGNESFRVYRLLNAQLERGKAMLGARRIYAFDRAGRSLLDTEGGVPIGREYPHLRIRDRLELEQVWNGQPAHSVLFEGEGGVTFVTGYAPVYFGDEIVAAVGVEIGAVAMDPIREFRRRVYSFAGVGALLTVVVGLLLARTITRPIQRLVAAAREIGQGRLQHEVYSSTSDEIGYLGETMEELRRKLLARDAQLRQMLAGVAHEIRNPLGSIELYAGLIADDLPDDDPRKAHIQKVIGEVCNLDQVISEFLEFARPAPPAFERTQISRLVGEAAFLLVPEMEKAGVNYHQDVDARLEVMIDSEQIKRAFFNLMRNAVQAMKDGGELRVRTMEEDGHAVVEVLDNGLGINRAVQERLFEPFFTTKEKGSGLGLTIVRKTLEENHGRIEVKSEEGRGTMCRVYLPRSAAGVDRGEAGQ